MAEEKHRMLYQGQDPSQPVWRARSLMAPSRESCAPETQEPPTYDDAMGNSSTLRMGNSAVDQQAGQASSQTGSADRHCSFIASALVRSQRQVEQPRQAIAHCSQLPPQQLQLDEDEVPVVARPQEQRRERGRPQQMHSVFAMTPQPRLGAKACLIMCPACGREGRTQIRYTASTRTHCWALWLCSIGWCCCACLYPYLVDSCRNTNHYCAVCKTFLGTYSPNDCC